MSRNPQRLSPNTSYHKDGETLLKPDYALPNPESLSNLGTILPHLMDARLGTNQDISSGLLLGADGGLTGKNDIELPQVKGTIKGVTPLIDDVPISADSGERAVCKSPTRVVLIRRVYMLGGIVEEHHMIDDIDPEESNPRERVQPESSTSKLEPTDRRERGDCPYPAQEVADHEASSSHSKTMDYDRGESRLVKLRLNVR
ncbi:hypothetical protein Nepgr_029669 [Nepenthes gracilis]|uniref:Uncharacterized protein n=1 Tax=Nepenthes gracilis TaxID=150966 RepID=A0AAD3Y5R2_NEPGR|nr:hypothetical protein Nepgr_029669 [Nepenthes gracilis]